MSSKLLKWLRVAVAAAVFAAITAAFVDFRGLVPAKVGHAMTGVQFVPSLIALLTGASLSLACIVIGIVTLAVGRIYCSALCPLGILQDVVIRLANRLKRKSRPAPYARPQTWWRQSFLWVTILAAVAGWGGVALTWLDPYSNFGRIASGLFRPVLTLANNAAVGVAEAAGGHGLYRVTPSWSGPGVLAVPVFVLLLIIVLAAWRGRLYCNTVCPVGTLLGWIGARAAFRLQIDREACRKCAACANVCKSQCIDLRSGSLDSSRCVACYNCLEVCREHGIGYRFAWTRPARTAAPQIAVDGAPNPQRRAFISKTLVGIAGVAGVGRVMFAKDGQTGIAGESPNQSPVICPPGSSSVGQFLDRCTACHLCVSECPTGVLQPALFEYGLPGIMKPRLEFSSAFCNFDCRRCGEVCPDGAIDLLELAAKQLTQIGEAHFFRDKCVVVTNGTDCAACSEHCPTKAVSTVPFGNNLRLPQVKDELCIGCGACEYACPAKPGKAIKVTGYRRHGLAKKNIQRKATSSLPKNDFPF